MSAEGEYIKALLEALNEIPGVFVWRQQAGKVPVGRGWMQLAPKGACDIIGGVRVTRDDGRRFGLLLSAEVKATKSGKAKDNGTGTLASQHKWRLLMECMGALHIDARKRDDEPMTLAVDRVVQQVKLAQLSAQDAC